MRDRSYRRSTSRIEEKRGFGMIQIIRGGEIVRDLLSQRKKGDGSRAKKV